MCFNYEAGSLWIVRLFLQFAIGPLGVHLLRLERSDDVTRLSASSCDHCGRYRAPGDSNRPLRRSQKVIVEATSIRQGG